MEILVLSIAWSIWIFWTKFPCGAQGDPNWTKIAYAQLDHVAKNVTINRSLWYLVTEEIEEQDIVYGQTDRRTDGQMDGRTTEERVSHRLTWSSTRRAKNDIIYTLNVPHSFRFVVVASLDVNLYSVCARYSRLILFQ